MKIPDCFRDYCSVASAWNNQRKIDDPARSEVILVRGTLQTSSLDEARGYVSRIVLKTFLWLLVVALCYGNQSFIKAPFCFRASEPSFFVVTRVPCNVKWHQLKSLKTGLLSQQYRHARFIYDMTRPLILNAPTASVPGLDSLQQSFYFQTCNCQGFGWNLTSLTPTQMVPNNLNWKF